MSKWPVLGGGAKNPQKIGVGLGMTKIKKN
jgi:hypothetical protein